MAEQDQQRSEQPTPYKLEQARKKGQAAKSVETSAFFVVIAFVFAAALSWRGVFADHLQLGRVILSSADTVDFTPEHITHWFEALARASFYSLAPLLAVIVVAAVLASLLQTGPIFAPAVLKPEVDRINPFAGLKRMFSMRTLFEAAKVTVKLTLVAAVMYFCIVAVLVRAPGLAMLDIHGLPDAVASLMARTVGWLLLLLAVVALIDLIFVRRDFMSRMRMSRRDLRDEVKQREGDPRVRSRIRELRREMFRRARSVHRVKDADVLITNPTHLAIAIIYKREQMEAPRVIAKGAGDVALRMREKAHQHRVAVVENPPLARLLFRHAKLDDSIPAKMFSDVARILVWVYATRQRRLGVAA